jgi:alpha-L-fucosidase
MRLFNSLKHMFLSRGPVALSKIGIILLGSFAALVSGTASGQNSGGGGEAHPALLTNTTALHRWKDMRFGMFIHWGPVTLRGTEIGWSRGLQVPIADYDHLYQEFNPALFNAREWVSVAKAAGMKYLVITSKHHDGFCLWDSKYTDYDIMSTPFRRDVLKELSEECARQGILFCTYYSILDWHHPHYTTRYGGDTRPVSGSDMNLYRAYLKGQVEELIKTYHTNMLWCDGEWEKSWTHDDGMDLYAFARGLNDSLLINNRVDKGREGMKGMTASGKYAGDFGTPEQEIGMFDNQRAWESCITVGTQWSWKPNDKLKSAGQCIQMLAKTAGGGGNLLLNISPMPDGRVEQRQRELLGQVGRWLAQYGESIYGTTGGPFRPEPWLAATSRGNRIYVHLFTPPKEELRLPLLPNRKIKAARLLGGGMLNFTREGSQIVIPLPRDPMDESDAVIALDLDGTAGDIVPLDVPTNIFKEMEVGDIRLKTLPGPTYPAHGARSLTDKVRGTLNYLDDSWMGYEKDDCEAVIDLRSVKSVSKVSVGCLQTQALWIFFPRGVDVDVSKDSVEFTRVGTVNAGEPAQEEDVRRKDVAVSFPPTQARWVKIRITNTGICPPWHAGAGSKAWLFLDEITVE